MPTPKQGLILADFSAADPNALAIWLKDKDSSWIGLAVGLKSLGIPFRITENVDEALAHDVMMVYPSLTGGNTKPESLQKLAAHVRKGGTLLAFNVIGGGMQEIFGFDESRELDSLTGLRFNDIEFNRSFASIEAEKQIPLSTDGQQDAVPGTGYLNTQRPAIASFNDGSAAISQNWFTTDGETGYAYALGLDFGHLILRAFNGRFSGLGDSYVNSYQPKVDSLLRFIAKVYRQGEDNAITLSPTPEGKNVTVLMTHDIDFTASIINVPAYAQYEASAQIPATYFIQTKYVKDYNDDYFFTPESVATLKQLINSGMEIGSHTVSHSNEFRNMPMGTGKETYPEYRPFVQDFTHVRDASISGELRVSKFLLEQNSGEKVVSFRPGHLSLPASLPQMLTATGYQFSSSITANEAMTHLPFRYMYDRSYRYTTNIFEFPVTIEDEMTPLPNRLNESLQLVRQISAYRGLVNILVHTETTGRKLEFVKNFTSALKDEAWFGTMSEYGAWWTARESVTIKFEETAKNQGHQITIASELPISGLTLELPQGWKYQGGLDGSHQSGNLLSLGPLDVSATINFKNHPRLVNQPP